MLAQLDTILDAWSLRNATVVVAVSGGADSVALLAALARTLPLDHLIAVHVNHHLRGEESEQDARFVARLAHRIGVSVEILPAPLTPEMVRAKGVEASARAVRYEALRRAVSARTGPGVIATAHTADDQAETVLLRLLTNASIESLAGIAPRGPDGVVRPLLGIRRATVREFAESESLEFRHDSSNDDPRFVRNRIRRDLLPELERSDPHVVERLSAIAGHVRAIRERIAPARSRLSTRWNRRGQRSEIAVGALPSDPDLCRLALLDEIGRLRPGGRNVTADRLAGLIGELREHSPISLGEGLTASLEGETLSIAPELEPSSTFAVSIPAEGSSRIPEIGASVHLERVTELPSNLDGGTSQVFGIPPDLDSSHLEFTVRSRLPGDRFRPLGMSGTRKLKDFLIDRRIPVSERDRLPLLVLGSQIIWVAGVEISEIFRAEPGRDLFEVRIDYDDPAAPENA